MLGCAAGFAGADYDLQDALVESTNKSSSKAERHGQNFYDYELAGPVSSSGLMVVFDGRTFELSMWGAACTSHQAKQEPWLQLQRHPQFK